MDNEAQILLDDTIAFCRRDGQDARLINMLAQSRALALDDEGLTVEPPSRFAYNYLVKQRDVIERYLEEIAFAPLALSLKTPEGMSAGATANTNEGAAATPNTRDGERESAPAGSAQTVAHATAQENRFKAGTGETAPGGRTPFSFMPPAGGIPLAEASQRNPKSVTVNNTMSRAAFDALLGARKGVGSDQPKTQDQPFDANRPDRGSEAAGEGADEQNDYPAQGINAKFTFENFVFGDENMHAYQSAVRFAAFADEPGQCTSLFIYGNSGLGKTHLLFAIKNYLAAEKPYMRVKYANSQAYIDDYMRDLGAQRGPGEPIMREYRAADVLIIDDIQNIIGRQASIEFFFQLVDEFIREGRKIVIASDRAPKKLGMDERLTSRFNSGMLCLVSEPGFEMKYAILKNYYEHTIKNPRPVAGADKDNSLLSMLTLDEGTLTDDHLRHMAEISGNNIRELQSFCERCAGRSYEKEQAGGELTAQDIDQIAETYFDTAHKVVSYETIQSVVEEFYHVSHEDMIGRKRSKNIAFPRHVAIYLTNSMCELSLKAVGSAFGRDHTTVIHSVEVIETKMHEDARFAEEIQQLKSIIMIKS